MNSTPDWSLWRSFSAVVAEGSLSGAARLLALSQPTIGRHIETLEQTLGVALFERSLGGLKPNATALRLYEPVEAARLSLGRAAIMAAGAQEQLAGTVRITASAVVSHYVLPTLLVPIREKYPAISVELVPSDSAENLLMREADIAIRMFRPTQLELIAKRLGELPMVTCAHESYLAKRGTPVEIEELYGHDLVGLDRSDLITAYATKLGFALTREHFAFRTDSQTNLFELIRAGLGIGFGQHQLVRRTPGMVAILPQLPVPALEVWLTTHRELFTSVRIRAIYDALAAGLVAYIEGHDV
ncbi:LysR family transcriptional regulator [Devosia sp.]|uniref:LysR family transcriptional regulator n=1 Tax=Devosia sp. TaxID=1871048 RepID=UPI0032658E33